MAYLVLVRHGESEWNAKGLWTGWTNVNLSEKGREQARAAGKLFTDFHFDLAFTSTLKRAQQTWEEIQTVINQHPQTLTNKDLNERDYGDLTGKNKWQVKKDVGEEEFVKLRRSWDYPPPHGESLKEVYNRVLPYYLNIIEPKLKEGLNIIIVAHGNSLRALVKYLDHVPDEQIASVELALGEPLVYQIDQQGKVISKEIRSIGSSIS